MVAENTEAMERSGVGEGFGADSKTGAEERDIAELQIKNRPFQGGFWCFVVVFLFAQFFDFFEEHVFAAFFVAGVLEYNFTVLVYDHGVGYVLEIEGAL